MAFDAGAIVGRLGLDISDYTRGMLQANSLASLFPSVVTNFLANPLLGFIGVAKQAASALVSLFTESADQADNMGDLAAQVGVSVEAISGLSLVASQAGADANAVADAFKFLGKNAAEAAAGGEAQMKAFASIGITAEQVKAGMSDLPSLMLEVADGLEGVGEGGARTNAAMDILGRSGTTLIPTLTQGSAAIREQIETFRAYGAVVTEESVRSADAWNDGVGELRIAWQGFKNLIAEPLQNALMPHLDELLTWARTHPDEMRAKAAEVAESIVSASLAIAGAARLIVENLRPVVALMGAIAGFKAGASIGTFFGPTGTLVGGLIGAGVGAAGGLAITSSPGTQGGQQFNVNNQIVNDGNAERVAREVGRRSEESMSRAFREMQGLEGSRQRRGGI